MITYIILLFTAGLVTYLLVRPKGSFANSEPSRDQAYKNFLVNSLKISLNFDSCKFRDSSFVEEVEEENSDYKLAGALVGSSIGYYYTPVIKEERVQTVLFYSDPELYSGKRFFQTFPMDLITLKYHLLNQSVTLYIDKLDSHKYLFDLKA